MGFIGYQFAWMRYTGNQQIALPSQDSLINISSDSRNNTTHYIYIGAQHEFSPNLSGMARGGVNIRENDNDPAVATRLHGALC